VMGGMVLRCDMTLSSPCYASSSHNPSRPRRIGDGLGGAVEDFCSFVPQPRC
jgi:hypothetical protein